MVIVSQDKETIINFENITRISLVPPVEKGYKYSISINGCLDLGYYTSKERAKEVLKKIIQTIENTSIVNLMENLQISIHDPSFGGSLSSVYYMPEDKED